MSSFKKVTLKISHKITEVGLMWMAYAGLSPVHAQEIPGGLQGGVDEAAGVETGKTGPSSLFGEDGVFFRVIRAILFLVGALSVLMLIVGGFRFVLASGNSDRVEGARNTIIYALIGLAVSILAYAIVRFIIQQLGGGDEAVGGV